MKRFALVLLVAGLTACGGTKDNADGNVEAGDVRSADTEIAGESPSPVTSIDAAVGFAGGMAAETPESALPKIESRPTPARQTREEPVENETGEAVVNVTLPPAPPANLTPPAPPVQ